MKIDSIRKFSFWKTIVLYISSAFFLFPNLFYITMGWYVRHRADDFCFSGTLREVGLIGGVVEFYTEISNRFSAFLVWSLSDMFGENAIRFFIMFAIVFLLIVLYLVIKRLFSELGFHEKNIFAVFVAVLLTFFILYLSPNIHQSVYWRAAMVHYFLPVPALLLLLLWIFKKPKLKRERILRSVLVFMITFFLAGLSESYAALQGGVFALIFLLYLVLLSKKQNQHLMVFSIASIFGTIAALLVMIVSPGNALKMTTLEQAPNVLSVIAISINSTVDFIYFSIRGLWLPFCILLMLGVLTSFIYLPYSVTSFLKRKVIVSTFLIPLITFLLIFCICMPTAYGMMAYPEKRVLMLAQIVLVFAIFCIGALVGMLIKPTLSKFRFTKVVSIISLLVLSFYPLLSYASLINFAKLYQKRAELWDQQYQEITQQKAEGKTNLVITAIDAHSEIAEMRDYKTFWVNGCVAQYYNVDTIIAVER